MSLLNVSVPEDKKDREPTALDNAGKVLGILTNIGNTYFKGYDTFVNDPKRIDATNDRTKAINNAASKNQPMEASSVVGGM